MLNLCLLEFTPILYKNTKIQKYNKFNYITHKYNLINRQDIIRTMGQQLALQQKQELTLDEVDNCPTNRSTNNNTEYVPKQGVLKIAINPFPNSTKIGSTINGLPIYAEKSKSLHQQIVHRKQPGSYFSQEQILDLIESTVYTLTSLEQQNVLYRDISSDNIFLTHQRHRGIFITSTKFKLFPNQLIQSTTYERLVGLCKKDSFRQGSYNFSPEMIIACRAREKEFTDESLLKKSNIFALGIVFLEAATLQSSYEFYDQNSLDIFQETIQKSLIEIDTRYGSIITKIIANMIDFDFDQRLEGFSQLAKWMIYQLDNLQSKQQKEYSECYRQQIETHVQNQQKIPIQIAFNKNKKVYEKEEKIQMLPVCYQTSRINIKSKATFIQSQLQNENTFSQNKIKIKIRQVPVYLQKNSSRIQNDKENRSRLIYSPFVNTNSNKSSDYTHSQKSKFDMLSYTKRSLAFQGDATSRGKTLKDFYGGNNICKTQR